MTTWLSIGKILTAQGLNGEVRVYPNSDFPERFLQPGKRWILRPGATEPEVVELKSGRYLDGKGLYVLRFVGVSDRTQAEALRNCQLMVDERDRPFLEEDEYHVGDLIGLAVFDQASQTLVGTVIDVLTAGNDLLQVQRVESGENGTERGTENGKENGKENAKENTVLIPFVKAIVPVVDLQNRRVEITPPRGLI